MNKNKFFNATLWLLVLVLGASCKSLDVYTEQTEDLYSNDYQLESSFIRKKGKKVIEKKKFYYKGEISQLMESQEEDDEETPDYLEKPAKSEIKGDNTYILATNKTITVESTTNHSFLFYTFFGKPFVMLGSTVWNLTSCAGYSLYNFMGGYNTIRYGQFTWKIPDIKKARQKAWAAKEENRIKDYPEYHKPFTNNKIEVQELVERKDTTEAGDMVKVISQTNMSYDNSLSVKKSCESDALYTYAAITRVGAVITVPVSAVCWLGGAVYGFYDAISN